MVKSVDVQAAVLVIRLRFMVSVGHSQNMTPANKKFSRMKTLHFYTTNLRN